MGSTVVASSSQSTSPHMPYMPLVSTGVENKMKAFLCFDMPNISVESKMGKHNHLSLHRWPLLLFCLHQVTRGCKGQHSWTVLLRIFLTLRALFDDWCWSIRTLWAFGRSLLADQLKAVIMWWFLLLSALYMWEPHPNCLASLQDNWV